MNIALLARKAVQRARRYGWRRTLRSAWSELWARPEADEFDRRYGTDTARRAPLWQLRIDSSNLRFGRRYETRSEAAIAQPLAALGLDLSDFTFVDLGCGKGRTLLVAARFGFRRLIGVEFSPQLATIARDNLALVKIANAEIVCADAAQFAFPDTDIVLYLFNPFVGEVMEAVFDHLRALCSRRVYVIYDTPDFAAIVDGTGFLTCEQRLPTPTGEVRIWKSPTAPALARTA